MTLDGALQLAWFAVDVVVLALVHRRSAGIAVSVAIPGGLAIGAGTAMATGDGFAVMRAGAWGLFLHLPLGLVALAVLTRGVRRWAAAAAAAVLAGVAVDAFLVEPHALEIARYTVPTDELDTPLRIVVLSDLQTDRVGAYERKAFERAVAERPDLIVLPGDFVQLAPGPAYVAQVAAFRALLPILKAPLGVWAVRGNVDHVSWYADLFAGTHVRGAVSTTTVDLGPLRLSALSFGDGFDPELVLPAEPGFHVAFAHGPDFSLSDAVGADLLVAGHTHGGQVQLPFLGPPLVLSEVGRAQGAGGSFALSGDRTLVVSRGVGLERGNAPRLRFRCRPQIVVIDVVPR